MDVGFARVAQTPQNLKTQLMRTSTQSFMASHFRLSPWYKLEHSGSIYFHKSLAFVDSPSAPTLH